MTRRALVKKQVLSFRDRAETFIALASQLEKSRYSDPFKRRVQAAMLNDAKQLTALVQKIMRRSDDMRTWAHDVFGDGIDDHPVSKLAGKIMTNSVNNAMGYQTYRIRAFLRTGRVEQSPQVAGTLVASGIMNLLGEVIR